MDATNNDFFTESVPLSLSKEQSRELQEQVYVLPCPTCNTSDHAKFSYVCDEIDGSILCRYCEVCKSYFGIDDSVPVSQIFELLQSGLLKTTKCTCGNDDVNKFVFDEIQLMSDDINQLVLKCTLCEYKTEVMNENEIDVSSALEDNTDLTAFDNQEDVLANLLSQIRNNKDLKEKSTCTCDTEDPSHFNVYLDMYGCLNKVECTNCGQAVKHPPKQQACPNYDVAETIGRTRIRSLGDLTAGDHIAWHQPLGYWHHAIIVDVELETSRLLVIEYSGPIKDGPPKFIGGVIVEHWAELNCVAEEIYRIEYKNPNPPDVVITKARTRLGEAKYNLLTNNCEHFARWCKTNHHRSYQVESFTDTLRRWGRASVGFATKYIFKSATKYLAKDALPEASAVAMETLHMGNLALTGGAACVPDTSQLVEKSCSRASNAMSWAGMGALVVLEGISCVRDIREAADQCRRGEFNRREFLNVVVKRVAQGAGGVAGTAVGGNVGQTVIPLPVVGGLVGCTLGYFLGQAMGALVGRKCVTLIDSIPEANVAVKYTAY